MNKKDYYEILGVSKDATDAEIKSAFRKLAKEHHPDVSKSPDAEAKFKEIGEAYAVLSDPQKKQNYDNFGSADMGSGQHGGFSGFDPGDINLDDILRSAFGGFGGFGGFGDFSSSPNYRSYKGEDILVSVKLTFEEAVFGVKKTIKVNLEEGCHKCEGVGGFGSSTCSTCGGRGRVIERLVFLQTETTCPTCKGSGNTYKDSCSTCSGGGILLKEKKIEVTIPQGVDKDTKLRLREKGHQGINGGVRGDIYIKFNIIPHPIFERIGNDIYLEVPITVSEAALGVKKQIPTLYGNVLLNIKPGVQNYTKLKLKDKGVKQANSLRIGDMYAVINIIVPRKLSKEEKALFKKLDELTLNKEEEFKTFNKHI